jgi:hypothetical protein
MRTTDLPVQQMKIIGSQKQRKSAAAKAAVSEILLGAEGSERKAVDIVKDILNHSKLTLDTTSHKNNKLWRSRIW